MKFYFVGLDLRDDTRDYDPVHRALREVHARRVSQRIWLCVVNRHRPDALTTVSQNLGTADRMMVVEVPPTMRLPEPMDAAAG